MAQEKKTKQTSALQIRLGAWFVGIVAILGWSFFNSNAEPKLQFPIEQRNGESKGLHRAPNISVIDWQDLTKSFAEEVVAAGRPVVIRSEQVMQSWAALSTWSNEYFVQKLGPKHSLRHVFWSGNRTVLRFQDYSELTDYPGTTRWYHDVSMSVKSFFSKLSEPEKHGYLYLATPVAWVSKDLMKDLHPLSLLSPIEKEASVQIWVGSVGVTTQMHYDIDYNFHLQVTGEKRFLLLPPSSQRQVKLYPMPHQYHRRSQINWDEYAPDDEWELSEQLVKSPDAMEFTLTKGDILYIPPFWFHYVTNLNAGMSVNVWTRAAGLKKALYDLWGTVPILPKGYSQNRPVITAFYREFLLRFMAEVAEVDDKTDAGRSALALHWQQRFALLKKQGQTGSNLDNDCSHVLPQDLTQTLTTSIGASIGMTRRLKQSYPDGYHAALGDFVDVVALQAVDKQHKLMATFIWTCFVRS